MWISGGEIGGACTCRPPRSRAAREREYSHSLHDPRFLSPESSFALPLSSYRPPPSATQDLSPPIICATFPLSRSSVSCLPPSYPTSRPLIRPFSQWRLGGAWRPIRHLTTPLHSHLRFSSPWVTSRPRSNLSRIPSCLWVVPYSRYGAFKEAHLVAVLPPISFFGHWTLEMCLVYWSFFTAVRWCRMLYSS
jgi:hypothetical protein